MKATIDYISIYIGNLGFVTDGDEFLKLSYYCGLNGVYLPPKPSTTARVLAAIIFI